MTCFIFNCSVCIKARGFLPNKNISLSSSDILRCLRAILLRILCLLVLIANIKVIIVANVAITDAITPILEKVTAFLTENQGKVAKIGEEVAGFVEAGLQKAIDAFQWCIDNKADYITTDNPAEANRQLGK